MWYVHYGRWWTLAGALFSLVIWAGIIALVVWVVVRLTRDHGAAGKDTALDIAKKRYASGEITREQFEQIKKDLQAPS